MFTQKLTGVLVVLTSRRKREKYVGSILPEATALTFVPSNNSISCFNSRIALTLPYLGTVYFFPGNEEQIKFKGIPKSKQTLGELHHLASAAFIRVMSRCLGIVFNL